MSAATPPSARSNSPPACFGPNSAAAPPSRPELLEPGEAPIIFFDGVCGLCARSVDFVIRRDPHGRFRFAPLQGDTARDRLHIAPGESLNSMVLLDQTGAHRRSDGVWRVLVLLGGVWRVLGWALRLIPPPIRNWGYELVARNRYRWFGKKEACRLPTLEERSRFLA